MTRAFAKGAAVCHERLTALVFLLPVWSVCRLHVHEKGMNVLSVREGMKYVKDYVSSGKEEERNPWGLIEAT